MNLQIAVIISMFGLFITMPLFVRYLAYTDTTLTIKAIGFICCCLTAVLPIFASHHWAEIYGKHFAAIEKTLYFIYIFAVILFTFTLLRDTVWGIGNTLKIFPSLFKTQPLKAANVITILLALLASGWAFYEGMKVPSIKELSLTSPKITEEQKIVVLSDLHINRTTSIRKIKLLVDKTNALKPDLILLAGDIVDDDVDKIKSTTQALKNLHAPQGVYFVSGNHEFYIGYQNAFKMLTNLGFTSLENTTQKIAPNFYLAGVADIPSSNRFGHKTKVQSILASIPTEAYTLLLTHSPTPMNLPFDLQVAGHTHGGQIFPFHVFTWLGNHHLLAGYYPQERIYISSGAGQWGPQMRFLAPAEITLIHLKSKGKNKTGGSLNFNM